MKNLSEKTDCSISNGIFSSSSCYIDCLDYSNSSVFGMISVNYPRILKKKEPNTCTILAMKESEDIGKLKVFSDLSALFAELDE